MTGEMNKIDQEGRDSNGEYWPLHAAIAKALGGTLKPFDAYQGPYISVPNVGKFWLSSDDGYMGRVYFETKGKQSKPFPLWRENSEEMAIDAAQSLIKARD